jgi:hypothetical protein
MCTEVPVTQQTDIKWLFERNVFEDGNPEHMAKRVRSKGMPCAEVAFECVDGNEQELRPAKPLVFRDDDTVMVYGSMNLMKWLLREQKWPALAWYDFPRLRCQSYYAHWGSYLLQRQYAFLPVAEIERRKEWVFQTFGRNASVFIRPDDNAKSFGGGIVSQDQFEQWYKLANFYNPGPDCLAVVSMPETIQAEWRFVIGDRQVVTGSQYRRDGKEEVLAGYPPDAAEFAESVARANDFNPHPVYVMDIASTDDGYRLIEIGSACCASLYAGDLDRVVDAVCKTASDNPQEQVTTTIGIVTRGTCEYATSLRWLGHIVLAVNGLWVVGGILGIGLAASQPQFFQGNFIGVPDDHRQMLRYAWVGGSIWGAYFGGPLAVIIGLVLFRVRWRRCLTCPTGGIA